MSSSDPTPALRPPRTAAGVHRTDAPGPLPDAHGVRAAFADPCGEATTLEEMLACQSSLDPFILY